MGVTTLLLGPRHLFACSVRVHVPGALRAGDQGVRGRELWRPRAPSPVRIVARKTAASRGDEKCGCPQAQEHSGTAGRGGWRCVGVRGQGRGGGQCGQRGGGVGQVP